MGIIVWLVVGGVVGWLASIVMRTDGQQGLILNVVVGIVGALLAGFVVSPLLGIYSAVTRQDSRGQPAGGWFPDQRVTLEEAVRGFTAGAAYAGFSDRERGMVKEGMVTKAEALDRMDAANLEALMRPSFDPRQRYKVIAEGVPASPGAAKGEIVFTADDAVKRAHAGHAVLLVREFTANLSDIEKKFQQVKPQ